MHRRQRLEANVAKGSAGTATADDQRLGRDREASAGPAPSTAASGRSARASAAARQGSAAGPGTPQPGGAGTGPHARLGPDDRRVSSSEIGSVLLDRTVITLPLVSRLDLQPYFPKVRAHHQHSSQPAPPSTCRLLAPVLACDVSQRR